MSRYRAAGLVASFVLLSALLVACGRGSNGPAAPDAPERLLAGASDLIVLADVVSVTEVAPARVDDRPSMPPGTDYRARLKVRETWRGPVLDSVDVLFNNFEKWPAPPVYVAGERVVAFLKRDGRAWTTVGMSGGRVVAGDSDLGELRAAVKSAVPEEDGAPT